MLVQKIPSDRLAIAADQKMKEEKYWMKKLSGELRKTSFPYNFKKSLIMDGRDIGGTTKRSAKPYDSVNFRIDGRNFSRLIEIINGSDVRLFIIMVSVLTLLLNKYTDESDIILGTPIYRQEIEAEFINTVLILKNRVGEDLTFRELLQQVGRELLEATSNQNYPIETLLYQMEISYSGEDDFPLFDIIVLLENIHDKRYVQHLNINMCFIFQREKEEVVGTLEYNTLLYRHTTISRIVQHFIRLMEAVIFKVDMRLHDFNILSDEERSQIISNFNHTVKEYPDAKRIHDLLEEQVERKPDRISVSRAAQSLTYSALNERANRLARFLKDRGVFFEGIVGIMVERSLEMLVGIFGILKTGAIYLPINPEYPTERIKFFLSDSGFQVMLTHKKFERKLSGLTEFIALDGFDFTKGDGKNLEIALKSRAAAYVIYTSGSTGRPKGVIIEHRSVVNRLNWMQNNFPIGERDVILHKTSFTFDVSVWELFWWSQNGASVCMLAPGDEISPEAIARTICQNKITTIHFVPTMLSVFLDYLEIAGNLGTMASLRQVFSSGEPLYLIHTKRFHILFEAIDEIKLVNLYGPTEATVDVSFYECENNIQIEKIPIGRPINNIMLYIVDRSLNLQPIGVPGELCISGDGLARGYLNKPDFTAERFVKNPFAPLERMYKTGDLASWLNDGNIDFLGRMDQQIQIRGFRVELGEVENRLLEHDEIREAVVTAVDINSGDIHICAYIVPENDNSSRFRNKEKGSFQTIGLTVSELRKHLSRYLPDYMIPSFFIKLNHIPVNINGKVNRQALPAPSTNINIGSKFSAPGNNIEKTIAEIWKEELNLDQISIYDSFFDLGGNSIKIIQVNNRLKEEFKRDIPIIAMFKYTTINVLAEYLSENGIHKKTVSTDTDRSQTEFKGKFRLKKLKEKARNTSHE